ncbi:NAD(P)-binding protein [Canariomyces notabilis]|uniref:NAD(P)-binding protein n=1 Tax=Canariomyces notabilis TaxID=2074819 RepID=A0AAN6QHV6_9PEZI|nr:NAD(P)-binding protein [Canariomyces arenarius]
MPVYAITGARAGIGREYIRQLSQHKENTIFALVRSLDSDLSHLLTIQQTALGAVHILECDVSSEDSVARLPERIKTASASSNPNIKINTLINNAAVLHSREETSLNLSSTALASHITSNVLGPAKVLQALLSTGLLAADARVANISSGIGSLSLVADGRINAEITPYSISKAALNMLTVHQARQLTSEEATKGMVVVAVDPGHVKTEMGGPNAVVEVQDSARGVLRTLDGLSGEDSGGFFLYTGEKLPW